MIEKTTELYNSFGGKANVYREIQGQESTLLLSYFSSNGGIKYIPRDTFIPRYFLKNISRNNSSRSCGASSPDSKPGSSKLPGLNLKISPRDSSSKALHSPKSITTIQLSDQDDDVEIINYVITKNIATL